MSGSPQPKRVRPEALRLGDVVGIVAPSSSFRRDDFESGCAELVRLGYQPFHLPSIFERELYFAGSVERRVHELHEMFRRREVKAVLCARGGYGCNYLLPHLDLELIRANPKIFAGCSDVTTLLTYFCDAAGLATFHGPMVAGDLSRPGGYDESNWLAVLSGSDSEVSMGDEEVLPLVEGDAEGVLYGGCLSMLCASLGTPYEIQTAGTILFLEDRAERVYRIDRMLMQLKLTGKFDKVRGIVFGEMVDCGEPGISLHDVIRRILGDLRIPVGFGLRSGHVSRAALTLPLGTWAQLKVTEEVELICDSAVENATETVVQGLDGGHQAAG